LWGCKVSVYKNNDLISNTLYQIRDNHHYLKFYHRS
jgi:hypothetical protein